MPGRSRGRNHSLARLLCEGQGVDVLLGVCSRSVRVAALTGGDGTGLLRECFIQRQEAAGIRCLAVVWISSTTSCGPFNSKRD